MNHPAVTIELVLTPAELAAVHRKMVGIGFFRYPDRFTIRVPNGQRAMMVEPHLGYHFRVRSDGATKEVRWGDTIQGYETVESRLLRELITLIEETIQRRPGARDTRPRGVGCA